MQIKQVAIIMSLLAISACEDDNIKQCADLQNDENKRPLALSFCEKAAQQGEASAQLFMAKAKLAEGERQQAVDLLEKSANQKNAEATFLLGDIHAENHQLEEAKLYYKHSCELHFIKACVKGAVLENQISNQQKNLKSKVETNKETKSSVKQQSKGTEKQRLEQERKQLEEKNRSVNIETLFMSEQDRLNAYQDFISILNQNRKFEDWVNSCYAKSNNKRGCFYIDEWIATNYEQSAKAYNCKTNAFFTDSLVKNRALRNIPELQNVTPAQLNRLVENIRNTFYDYLKPAELINLLGNMECAKSQSNNNGKIDTQGLDFQENLAKFEQNGLWGFVDRQGNIVIRPQFYAVGGFYNGRAAVKNASGKWGYINKKGHYIISPQYCMAEQFSEGLANVYVGGLWSGFNCYGGKWGFIDTNGNFVINAVLDEATRFNKGKAKVTYQGQSGYINRNGNWVN